MTFKMTITHTHVDGSTDKIEIENGTYQDTRTLFNFLEPIVNSIYSIEPKKTVPLQPMMKTVAPSPASPPTVEEKVKEPVTQATDTKPVDEAPVEPTIEVEKEKVEEKVEDTELETSRSHQLPLLGSPLQNTFSIAEKLYLQNFDGMPAPSNDKDPLVRDENEPEGLVHTVVEKDDKDKSPAKGIAQIHCPDCGTQTSKQVNSTSRFVRCPKCKVKLFLFALHEVPGKPDAQGISFRANNVYLSPKERFEYKQSQQEKDSSPK